MRSYLSLILVLCLLMMSVACTQTPAVPADDFSDTLLPADLPVPSRENPFFSSPITIFGLSTRNTAVTKAIS